jgi:hypothetical protein
MHNREYASLETAAPPYAMGEVLWRVPNEAKMRVVCVVLSDFMQPDAWLEIRDFRKILLAENLQVHLLLNGNRASTWFNGRPTELTGYCVPTIVFVITDVVSCTQSQEKLGSLGGWKSRPCRARVFYTGSIATAVWPVRSRM